MPPLVEPPVVVLPLELLLTVVLLLVPVALTLPLEPDAVLLLDEVAEVVLDAVVPSASAWPPTRSAMTADEVTALNGKLVLLRPLPFFLFVTCRSSLLDPCCGLVVCGGMRVLEPGAPAPV